MTAPLVPFATIRAAGAMAASADHLATQAGLTVLARGGGAVDAAIAANAVLAVTGPHLCGLGGDLFALVHVGDGPPLALDASGRAPAAADPAALRAEGHRSMPFHHDIRSVTIPGCVDGWVALHGRFGRLPLGEVLAPAIALAERGFPASPLLVGSLAMVDERARAALGELAGQATRPGALVRRRGVSAALRAVALQGRTGFYGGRFGEGLVALGGGHVQRADLDVPQATWVESLSLAAWGHTLWTIPPGSQGYLTLTGAAVAAGLDLPGDPGDPLWAHLLVEAARAVGHDRPAVLHDRADPAPLLDPARLTARRTAIRPDTAASWPAAPENAGDTTYLCVVDAERTAVSLIQSNASGFGSWLVEPSTGVNLHNRGIGFSLEPGHPAELGPGRRPPHTLSPAMITRSDGGLWGPIGTMGGDGQPQILLQLLARLLHHGQSPARAIEAARWMLQGPTGFDTWTCEGGPEVLVEGHAPVGWDAGLAERGHRVRRLAALDSAFGHAHVIVVEEGGLLAGAADPRSMIGSCAGL